MSETHLQIDDKAIAPLSRHQAKPFPANLAEISGVTKCFGYKTALRNVSFSVPAG